MKLELILSKVQNIRDYINLILGEIDAGPLGNNPLSDAMVEVKLSQMVREIATKVVDKKISNHIYTTGKNMMQSAMAGLEQGWEDGDDICPPYRPIKWWHFEPQPVPWFGGRFDEASLNPQPLPPVENLFTGFSFSGREIMLAETLRIVASLTISSTFNEELKSAALYLARGAASAKAYEDFENKCGSTGPRIPFPHRRMVVEQ